MRLGLSRFFNDKPVEFYASLRHSSNILPIFFVFLFLSMLVIISESNIVFKFHLDSSLFEQPFNMSTDATSEVGANLCLNNATTLSRLSQPINDPLVPLMSSITIL